MRTITEAEKYWAQLDQFQSLTDLKISVSSHSEPQVTVGLRSVCWKIFLIFKTLDRSIWTARLSESRATYDSLRTQYLRAFEHPDEFDSSVDPLSENEKSPWVALRADETLRAEIFQDIERCMPDNVYFRQPATQNMMLDVIFVWCKMHPKIGYRQGMHEILAPILWVIERDAADTADLKRSECDGVLADIVDSRYIEHDSFTLFEAAMRTAKSFYAPAEEGSASTETPMLARSSRIFNKYLPKVDPSLSAHLIKLDIVPQIFLLRWIRLLFGREFPLDSVLNMWDALFAIDSTLELVDMISIAMLLRIRWQLVAADTNEAFSLLLRYPEPDAPAYTFIKDALYLRDHLTPEGGAEIITRYGKKAPPIQHKSPEIRATSPVPSFVSSRMRHTLGSPRSSFSQQGVGVGGLESLIQNATKGVLDRSSQWNVGKAIRDAVGEVKKNVEAIQSASGHSTPRSGGREFRKPATSGEPSLERARSANLVKKVEGLEKRNKDLARMLEGAIGELWEHHKEQSERKDEENKGGLEALSLAIAKVQFVQVYLEDMSIPLPVEETSQTPEPSTSAAIPTANLQPPAVPERTSSAPPASNSPPTSSSSALEPRTVKSSDLLSPTKNIPAAQPTEMRQTSPDQNASPRTSSPRPRPLLSSPSFAWMLGPNPNSETADIAPRSAFAKASEHSAFASDEKRRMRGGGMGFLFGDDEGGGEGGEAGKAKRSAAAKKGKRQSGSGKGGGKGGAEGPLEAEEEVIDLDDVRAGVV